MTIYVVTCRGKYLDTPDGGSAADRVELIAAFSDYQRALALVESGTVDVKEPTKWGVRAIDVESVELNTDPPEILEKAAQP